MFPKPSSSTVTILPSVRSSVNHSAILSVPGSQKTEVDGQDQHPLASSCLPTPPAGWHKWSILGGQEVIPGEPSAGMSSTGRTTLRIRSIWQATCGSPHFSGTQCVWRQWLRIHSHNRISISLWVKNLKHGNIFPKQHASFSAYNIPCYLWRSSQIREKYRKGDLSDRTLQNRTITR